MADGRTQIMVALIGVAGVLGAAYIAKGGGSATASRETSSERPVDIATDAAANLSKSQERAFTGAASALDSVSEQIEASSGVSSAPDISGTWHDSAGYRFDFTQSGANYAFKQYFNGGYAGNGQGVLTGRKFQHSFADTSGLTGTCVGEVSADLKSSGGNCTSSDGDQWQFFVKR